MVLFATTKSWHAHLECFLIILANKLNKKLNEAHIKLLWNYTLCVAATWHRQIRNLPFFNYAFNGMIAKNLQKKNIIAHSHRFHELFPFYSCYLPLIVCAPDHFSSLLDQRTVKVSEKRQQKFTFFKQKHSRSILFEERGREREGKRNTALTMRIFFVFLSFHIFLSPHNVWLASQCQATCQHFSINWLPMNEFKFKISKRNKSNL